VPDAFERKNGNDSMGKEHNISESEERGRSEEMERRASRIPVADRDGEIINPGGIVSPELKKEVSPAALPPPALDVEK
jgi:inositol hexakisphosphate/diphosphoinositol-pentakisphosphate kinase